MNDAEFAQLLRDPATRTAHYQRLVQAYFARVTEAYRQVRGDCFHLALFAGAEALREALITTECMLADEGGFRSGMRILDIGCGLGGPAVNIAEYSGAHIYGVNLVASQLTAAQQRAAARGFADYVHVACADGMHLPFPDGVFDCVYHLDAGRYMPDKARLYAECSRVLRPGGSCVGLDWLRQSGLTPDAEAQYIEPLCRHFAVPHLATLSDLERDLTAAHFDIELLEDASTRGDILRNWDTGERATPHRTAASLWRRTLQQLFTSTPQVVLDGQRLLLDAVHARAFLLGHWCARKATPTTQRMSHGGRL